MSNYIIHDFSCLTNIIKYIKTKNENLVHDIDDQIINENYFLLSLLYIQLKTGLIASEAIIPIVPA